MLQRKQVDCSFMSLLQMKALHLNLNMGFSGIHRHRNKDVNKRPLSVWQFLIVIWNTYCTSHWHIVYSIAKTVRQCGISYKSISLIQHNINQLKYDIISKLESREGSVTSIQQIKLQLMKNRKNYISVTFSRWKWIVKPFSYVHQL